MAYIADAFVTHASKEEDYVLHVTYLIPITFMVLSLISSRDKTNG
jgi:hypothetical protein